MVFAGRKHTNIHGEKELEYRHLLKLMDIFGKLSDFHYKNDDPKNLF